jgi:hypothetical protein
MSHHLPREETTMDIDTLYPSKYLKASDLKGLKHTLTIAHLEVEELGEGDDKQVKPVIYFDGKDKGLVCNKTNAQMVASKFGNETDAWVGQDIILYPTKVQFAGEMKDAIRIEHVLEEAFDDDIKF